MAIMRRRQLQGTGQGQPRVISRRGPAAWGATTTPKRWGPPPPRPRGSRGLDSYSARMPSTPLIRFACCQAGLFVVVGEHMTMPAEPQWLSGVRRGVVGQSARAQGKQSLGKWRESLPKSRHDGSRFTMNKNNMILDDPLRIRRLRVLGFFLGVRNFCPIENR